MNRVDYFKNFLFVALWISSGTHYYCWYCWC